MLELDNGRDYRLSRLLGRPLYYAPDDAASDRALEAIFVELTDGEHPAPLDLEVKKRKVHVPRQACRTAWFEFADLCAQALGAVDYLALAEAFDTVIIAHVPRLGPERRDEARRFNTLSSCSPPAAAPEALYTEGDGAFEFQRTVSRLMEMQSADYVSSRRSRAAMAGVFTPAVLAASR